MEKQKLIEAKEKALELIVEKLNKGDFAPDYFMIISNEINSIKFEEDTEKRKAESNQFIETMTKYLNR